MLATVIPPFNPDDVKLGNIKDPEKIAAKIEEARCNHFENFKSAAALDAKYGNVLAIGWADEFSDVEIAHGDEFAAITTFFEVLHQMESGFIYGYNIKGFDLPFLFQRAWILGISPPRNLRSYRGGRTYWNDSIVDLMEAWCMGRDFKGQSLDSVARALGVGSKTGHGARFAQTYAADQKAALDYLTNDVNLVAKVAERMGV
jgi:DNA polymerase elongation subunit (family B)